jgi:Fe-S-cluster containining protein
MIFTRATMTEKRSSAGAPAANEVQDPSELDCLRCGHCCGPYFALYVGEEDEQHWEREGRQDLLDRLEYEREHVLWDDAGPYHCDTGERFVRCVFLRDAGGGQFLCGIHWAKPKICREYPPGTSSLCTKWKGVARI